MSRSDGSPRSNRGGSGAGDPTGPERAPATSQPAASRSGGAAPGRTSPWGAPVPPPTPDGWPEAVRPDASDGRSRSTNGSRSERRGRSAAPPVLAPILRPVLINRTRWWQRVRAIVVLVVIATILGGALASTLGLIVWGIATGIHHAATN